MPNCKARDNGMKKSHAYLLIIALKASGITTFIKGCPTCVGEVTPQSPTFFSNRFYNPNERDDENEKPNKEKNAQEENDDKKE